MTPNLSKMSLHALQHNDLPWGHYNLFQEHTTKGGERAYTVEPLYSEPLKKGRHFVLISGILLRFLLFRISGVIM